MRLAGLLLLLAAALAARPLAAQPLPPLLPDTTAAAYGASTALIIRLDEYGFGLGTAARGRLTDDLSLTFEAAIGSGKDAREQQFAIGGILGDTVTPLKRNYVLLLPAHLGIENRLFRQSVESNFRPYVAASGGPVLALQWPYFDDANGDGIRQSDSERRLGAFGGLGSTQPRLGVSGSASVGAYFGNGTQRALGLRFAFVGHYFPAEVDLLEVREDVETPSRRWFLTPVVSFHIVRLLD
ncbi:MAG: hypothetical protein AAFQ43_13950, partial [Bacteroidota bacterium]